jgi:hypothetical protein
MVGRTIIGGVPSAAAAVFPLLLARTAGGCTWERLLLSAACFCLFSLRRFLIPFAVVDFLFDTKHEHLGFGGSRLGFFYVEIKSFPCLPRVLSSERPSHCLLSRIQQGRVSQREKMELVPFWTAGVRPLAGVFLLQTNSGKWLGRLSHCAFSHLEAFVLWTLTFHRCIVRSMQILNERESRICCWLAVTMQYTSRIKSNNITQCLTETQQCVWHCCLHVSARMDQNRGKHVKCGVKICKFYI